MNALISTGELAARLGEAVVLDGSHHLPTAGRDAGAEFLEAHIPGARFFDIDGVADRASDLPHMLPDAKGFALAMGAMGITRDDEVVVYDTVGTTGAARVWWTFRAFGHERVSVLDGGLPKWRSEGRPVEAGYAAVARPELVRARADMLANIGSRAEQVLDARSAGRFAATEPEPRAGMRGGHIPGSLNLPYTELLDRRAAPSGTGRRSRPRSRRRGSIWTSRWRRPAGRGSARPCWRSGFTNWDESMRPSMTARGANGDCERTRR